MTRVHTPLLYAHSQPRSTIQPQPQWEPPHGTGCMIVLLTVLLKYVLFVLMKDLSCVNNNNNDNDNDNDNDNNNEIM